MNARSQIFEFAGELRQAEEITAALFHTLLFHRSLGKFHYKQEGSYSVGTVGFKDVDCDFIDVTYVQCDSEALDHVLRSRIVAFIESLQAGECGSGEISLEFFQKKRQRWLLPPDSIPWEVWMLKFQILHYANEQERQMSREELGELVGEKVRHVAASLNRQEYVPKMPNHSELDLIFDTSFPDIQPYLFKINHQEGKAAVTGASNVGSAMKKLFRDTLTL
ncbi:unnamed protein product [Darwinula stevensoni]|uniref:Autophagy-related protein 101 n=1 Tax=Darwinula stevensoni TaxID=69355 RepID=A0A7R8X8L3_9CRUS|nr:unnamed protein product [Darwinula stevensoni]CAG0883591.1 unnamed protein product [Darwinula stevensoni]